MVSVCALALTGRFLLAWSVAALVAWSAGVACAQTADGSHVSSNRVIHRFDFDERAAGNLEDLPKYWVPLRPPGFPHYAHGRFDFERGRLAPPSFYLASEGRSVAFQYTGPATRVRANVEYRIEGYVRPDRLRHGRACLSAHFLDKYGQALRGTLVRSRYVGGPRDAGDWVKVELYLPAAPVNAHTIGLLAWVLQEPAWRTTVPSRRHISRRDVRGGTWFDDIMVYAVPYIRITTSGLGNILVPGESQELRVTLADDDGATLSGEVSITAADGNLVETHPVSVEAATARDSTRIAVGHLPPGLYHARMEVSARDLRIVSRQITFARLGERDGGTEARARPFGVVVDAGNRSDPLTELRLLDEQAVRSAKLPIGTGLADSPSTAERRGAEDQLLQELVRDGFVLTGVFDDPPSALARGDGTYRRSLIELLSSDPSTWTADLTGAVAPYASTFRWWQIGGDLSGGAAFGPPVDQLARAAGQLREAMRPFVIMPQLSIPASSAVALSEKLPVQQISLAFGSEIQTGQLPGRLHRFEKQGYEKLSAYVEPLPADQYQRLARLADWAQRIITLRHAGADTVYVPQTWRVRETPHGPVTEPTEEFLVLRTIADVIGDAKPGQRIRLADNAQCLAFHRADSAVLAIWDPNAPPGGSRSAIQLGSADRQIDLWGRPTALSRDDHGRHVVRLSAMPTLVPGVERWLLDLRASISLSPTYVESGLELVRHDLEMDNKGDRIVAGSVVLNGPESWKISPRSFSFNFTPRQKVNYPLEIRYPHNEPAGEKRIVARIELAGDGYHYMEVPLWVSIGLTDVDVSGWASVEGADAVLHHVVTNRSSGVLSFRGSANVPGRERQYRPFLNLQPGQTQTVEYRARGGANLTGRRVRLVLREMNDGPRSHNLELVVP